MFSKYSVKKPYTVLVGVVLVIVLSVVSLMKMTTDLLPDMSFQYALIITTDIGASPEEVESDVTAPIEAAIATTSNIKNVGSISYNSYSIVTCEYEQNANMDSVVIEIQQELDKLKAGWSDSVGSPVIMKINPDMLPILMAAVDVKGLDRSELADYVDNELIPQIESIEGVASVSATGKIKESVQVTLNQKKIDALNEKIQGAINKKFDEAQAEIDSGASQIEQGQAQMNSASAQLAQTGTTVTDLINKKGELAKTKDDLEKKYQELKEQQTSLTLISTMINSFVQLDSKLQPDFSANNNIDNTQLVEMLKGYGITEEQIQAIISGLENETSKVEAGLNDAYEEVNNKMLSQLFGSLGELGIKIESKEDLVAASKQINELLVQVNTGLATMEDGLAQLDAGEISISDALDTINSSVAIAAVQMGPGAAQLAVAASALESAQGTLDSAKQEALSSADANAILSVDTLSGILVAQNFSMPAGYVDSGEEEKYLVKVGDSVNTVEELEELVLIDMGMDEVGTIRLSDVADIEMIDNAGESYAVVNGNPGVILSMEKQTGYSTGEVTDRILDKFKLLEKENKDLTLATLMDQGVYIDIVIDSVVQNMIIGAILAIIVLFIFLKDFKPTLVIACSIPLSVVTAIVLMYFTGISLNIISMSGLVLGIGMLVDNSIVVIENIYRLRGEGYSVKKAAVEGSKQVTGAIFASTLTTVSVYAPIIFTEGITRQLFVDLALTIAFTLSASLFVAITFVPAVSSAILKKTKKVKTPWFDSFKEWYAKILKVCLKYKIVVFIVSVALLAGSAILCVSRGMGFMNMEMVTNQISVTISAKEDQKLSFEELTSFSDEVIDRISDIKGIETIGATAGGSATSSLMSGGSDSVSMYIIMDMDSGVKASEITDEIKKRTEDLDCKIKADSSSMDYTAMFGQGVSVQIKGRDIDKLQELAKQVAGVLEDTKGIENVKDGLDDATPELRISVDKEKAAKKGQTVAQVFQIVYQKMATEKSATTVRTDIKDYDVFIQTEEQEEVSVDDIKNLTFTYTDKEGNSEEVALTDIATIEEASTLSTISRDAQTRYLTVSGSVDKDHNVTLLSDDIKKKIAKLDIPEGYTVEMKGEDETINEAMGQLVLMLLLAVIFIYLIMVAQFQSLLSPFIIMFCIPLAFTGGFIALFITGVELDVISMLGFIMLAGLIVNNGIVLIDYINQARREGMSKKDAIVDAGKTRVRPILMTALTTILAMSTSAVGLGEGSEMMKPMAIAIIGGLIYGTILTLIVIPCLYDAFNKEKNMVEEEL